MVDEHIKHELQRMFKFIGHWKGITILKWHVGDEHIHLYVAIPPKYSVSYIVNILKGKTSSWIKKKNKKIPRGSYWGRGYFVSTVGINEFAIRKYIENQRKYQMEQPRLL